MKIDGLLKLGCGIIRSMETSGQGEGPAWPAD